MVRVKDTFLKMVFYLKKWTWSLVERLEKYCFSCFHAISHTVYIVFPETSKEASSIVLFILKCNAPHT